jgi:hypothetical protein
LKGSEPVDPDLDALAADLGKAENMEAIQAALEKHAPGMSLKRLQVLFKLHATEPSEERTPTPPARVKKPDDDEAITLPSASLK